MAPPKAQHWPAFEELIRAHHADLRRFAHHLVGDPHRAEDALQEAYLKAYRACDGFVETTEGSQAGWLYRIVYRCSLDELRRAGRSRMTGIEDVPDPVDHAADPEGIVIARLSLAAALARIPAESRAAVLLVDGKGLDYATAAQILAVPVGTIASRLNAARLSLRKALGLIGENRGDKHD